VLLATHDPDLVRAVADRALHLSDTGNEMLTAAQAADRIAQVPA